MAKCVTLVTFYAYTGSTPSSSLVPYTVPVVPSGSASGSCAGYLLMTQAEYDQSQALYQSLIQPFDYAQAGVIFGFFFSFTVATWYVAKNIGVILDAVRRW